MMGTSGSLTKDGCQTQSLGEACSSIFIEERLQPWSGPHWAMVLYSKPASEEEMRSSSLLDIRERAWRIVPAGERGESSCSTYKPTGCVHAITVPGRQGSTPATSGSRCCRTRRSSHRVRAMQQEAVLRHRRFYSNRLRCSPAWSVRARGSRRKTKCRATAEDARNIFVCIWCWCRWCRKDLSRCPARVP